MNLRQWALTMVLGTGSLMGLLPGSARAQGYGPGGYYPPVQSYPYPSYPSGGYYPRPSAPYSWGRQPIYRPSWGGGYGERFEHRERGERFEHRGWGDGYGERFEHRR